MDNPGQKVGDDGAVNAKLGPLARHVARYGMVSLLVVMLAPMGVAQAAPPDPAWAGVWRGTIGNAPVQVCLQHEDSQDFGAYYYLRHLAIISLGKLDGQPDWTESPNSDQAAKGPLWHFTSISNGHLQGVWSQGAKTLPLSLDRVPLDKATSDDDDGTVCGNRVFSMPRFTKPVITIKPAMLKRVAYLRVLVDPGKQFDDSNSEAFQLLGSTPAIKRVNAELYKTVPTGPDNADYFICSIAA